MFYLIDFILNRLNTEHFIAEDDISGLYFLLILKGKINLYSIMDSWCLCAYNANNIIVYIYREQSLS
jgi:hypothetical protein